MVNKITTPPTTSELIGTVNELVDDKQDTLVSGTNIKTINNTSILGSGNIDIQGGGSYTAGTGIDITNDVISVTSAISSGASAGATAVQPSALNGYATQAWVGQQGYITGITSSDVTTALGYTPYNSTNPNGYTSNVGTVTSVNNTQPDANGNVTLTIPDTATWGNITGTLSDQTDLQDALDTKQDALTAGTDLEIIQGTSVKLPEGFTQLEYIQFTGTQYINTGILGNAGLETDVTFSFDEVPEDNSVLASRVGQTRIYPIHVFVGWCLGYGGYYNTPNVPLGGVVYNVVTVLEAGQQTMTVNNYRLINRSDDTVYNTDIPLYLGARAKASSAGGKITAEGFVKIKLYRIKIKSNDVLVFDGVPCDNNGTIGLYDLVSETLLTNQGTGSFIAGAEVPSSTIINFTNGSGYITSSALNGYATQAWVGQQGYITGITSSDVTTALGYTPYNASNPSGYITSSALVPYALSANLANVATSGSYNDLSNKPTIPAAQVNSDWNATSGVARILNKPTIPTVPTNVSAFKNDAGYITNSALAPYALSADLASVATSGSYNDLSDKPTIPAAQVNSDWNATSGVARILNKPTIPTVNNPTITFTQGGTTKGTITLNQSSNQTIALDAGGADIDLSNITSTGKNIANWSTNVSNCITEIPQDIKLDLNNGTLTLKAGSKVYKPDNSFIEVANDISIGYGIAVSGLVAVLTVNQKLYFAKPQYVTSGNTAPTTSNERQVWYDTTANIVKMYAPNSSNFEEVMLPIAIVSSSGVDNKFASIDQVFNGFGYIGSTIFALPGVKGLIPNGRNADGSLNNIEIVLNSVTVINNPDTDNKLQYLMLESNGYFTRGNWYYEQTQAPSWFVNNNNIWYNPETNRMYYYRTSTDQSYRNFIFTGLTFRGSGGSTKISEFNQAKLPFRAVDYNDVVLKQDLATVHCVVETYVNGTSWYRVYDDGWCEQGGRATISSYYANITFLKQFVDTNYNIGFAQNGFSEDTYCANVNNFTNSTMQLRFRGGGTFCFWQACGYIN